MGGGGGGGGGGGWVCKGGGGKGKVEGVSVHMGLCDVIECTEGFGSMFALDAPQTPDMH